MHAETLCEPQLAGVKMASQIFSHIESAYEWYKHEVESSATSINIGHSYNFLVGNRSSPTYGSALNPTVSEYLLFKWVYSKIAGGGTGFRMSGGGTSNTWATWLSNGYHHNFGFSGYYNLIAQNQFTFLYTGISFGVIRIPSPPVTIKSLNLYDTTHTASVTNASQNLSQEQLAARIRGIDPNFKVPWPPVVERWLIIGIVALLAATLVVRFVFSPQNQYGYRPAMAGQVKSETSPGTLERLVLDSLPALILDQIISLEKMWMSKLYEVELATQSVPAVTSAQLTVLGMQLDGLAAAIKEKEVKIEDINQQIKSYGKVLTYVGNVNTLELEMAKIAAELKALQSTQTDKLKTSKYLIQCAVSSVDAVP